MWLVAALMVSAPVHISIRPPVISQACQGELCYETGDWIAKRDLPLFDRLNATKRIGTIRKGTNVVALESRVVTSKLGLARMLRSGDYLHKYASLGPRVHLRKGELIYLLHLEGEGLHAGMTLDGRRVSVNDYAGDGDPIDFRQLRSYAATDWVRVRLPDGRVGWSSPSNAFLCSSHMDDMPGQCESSPSRH